MDTRGPKALGQRLPCPRQALLARRVRRCPPWSLAETILLQRFRVSGADASGVVISRSA